MTIKEYWPMFVGIAIASVLIIFIIHDVSIKRANAEERLVNELIKIGCDELENNIIVQTMYYSQKGVILKDSQMLYDIAYKKLRACGLPT